MANGLLQNDCAEMRARNFNHRRSNRVRVMSRQRRRRSGINFVQVEEKGRER
jgi:hypothetical protein